MERLRSREPLLNIKSIYNSPYCKGAQDLISYLSEEDIYATSRTASHNKISPENIGEAIDVILIHTPDIETLFSYRRIGNQVLTKYLLLKGVNINGHFTSYHLINNVLKLWAKLFPKQVDCPRKEIHEYPENTHVNSFEKDNHLISVFENTNDEVSRNLKTEKRHVIRSDNFAIGFCEWFYSSLNNSHSKKFSPSNFPDSSMFCSNASVDLFINPNLESAKEIHVTTSENCAAAICDVVTSSKLLFSPNLETGCQAAKSSHGLIKVFSCGTLHKNDEFIGIFEQEFGLVQSPVDKNWKIFFTKANFKTSGKEDVPSLPPCTVFEIEEND